MGCEGLYKDLGDEFMDIQRRSYMGGHGMVLLPTRICHSVGFITHLLPGNGIIYFHSCLLGICNSL